MKRQRGLGLKRVLGTVVLGLSVLLLGYLAGVGVTTLTGQAHLAALEASVDEQQGAPEQAATQSAVFAPPSSVSYTAWNADENPNYYRVDGPAIVDQEIEAGAVAYGPLDELGRATGAATLATYDSMSAGRARERADISALEPSGWGHNAEVDIAMPNGQVYHGQLFNRSHLVAKSLGGDDDLHNLVTATRTQNVGSNLNGVEGGMAYAEGLARTWLEGHRDGTVYYAARPVYEGDELVARSVIVDVRTSDGSIDQRIEVYNTALGFDIDYATGAFQITSDARELSQEIRDLWPDSQEDESTGVSATGAGEPVEPTGTPEAGDGERKVIVTGSGKAYHHDDSCSGLTNARSMEWVSVSEAEAMGRHPCGICGG